MPNRILEMVKSIITEIVEDLSSIRHEFRLMPDVSEHINKKAARYNNKTNYFDRVHRAIMFKGYYIEEPWSQVTVDSILAEWENRKHQNKQNGR
jgi:hypothetical protein